jgi:hypothetical protein
MCFESLDEDLLLWLENEEKCSVNLRETSEEDGTVSNSFELLGFLNGTMIHPQPEKFDRVDCCDSQVLMLTVSTRMFYSMYHEQSSMLNSYV